jgi:hypothetical protein
MKILGDRAGEGVDRNVGRSRIHGASTFTMYCPKF